MADWIYRLKLLIDTARLQTPDQLRRVRGLLDHRRHGQREPVPTAAEERALRMIGDFVVCNGEHSDRLRMVANLRQYDWVVAGCPR